MSTQAPAVGKEDILVVDDEPTIRTMLHRFLTQAGHTVCTATNADDALTLCREQTFALVLTDLKMPGTSGTELVHHLRMFSPTTEVVVMTGYPTIESAIQTLRAGAYDYVLKPFSLDVLQSVVTRCLEHRRLRGELASERQLRQDLEEANRFNARLRDEAEQNARELRRLSMELRRAQETERQRIARDLHDGVVQSLSLMSIHLDLLASTSGSVPSPQRAIQELRNLLAQTLNDVRSLVWTLRPRILDDLGLADALAQLVAHNSVIAALDISLEVDESLPLLSSAVTTTLYRISQEALANVLQHANATTASVQVEGTTDMVRLTIADNGRGYEVTPLAQSVQQVPALPVSGSAQPTLRGIGLWSMHERAVEVGGTVAITSIPGRGTTIVVEIPTSVSEKLDGGTDGTDISPTR